MKPKSAARPGDAGEPIPIRAEIEAQLAERIFRIFELWNDCPAARCRRNRRCLKDPCMIVREPMQPDELQWIGRRMRKAAAEYDAKMQASGIATET